ncbi:UNVERIFIED_CONTAM: hypothetical protein K2H54_061716 [Gekko kuhli]
MEVCIKRSYLTPVRDEEAESLRKARSRQARQTRRSTQGVTLTDLQEAERTFSRSRSERQTQEQPSEKSGRTETAEESSEKGDETSAREPRETLSRWSRNLDEESVSHRLRCPAPDKATSPISPTVTPFLYSSSRVPRTSKSIALDSVSPADFQSTSVGNMEKNEYEDQDLGDRSSSKQSVRERRRPKERRRGTGISFFTKDDEEMGDTEEVKEPRVSVLAQRTESFQITISLSHPPLQLCLPAEIVEGCPFCGGEVALTDLSYFVDQLISYFQVVNDI